MSVTEAAKTVERWEQIDGLRALADFLDSHPDVPVPLVSINGGWRNRKVLAAWVDGLDELVVEAAVIESLRRVVRRFAGLNVSMTVDTEVLGEVREVPSTATELVPFTLAEIREHAAEVPA